LQYLADHDVLTGCLNRRSFFEAFANKLEYAEKNGEEFACLMIDLDYFKRVNDHFGHAVGDLVISGMAKILKDNCGERDLVGRYGGEEFCIGLVDRTKDECSWLADQIREQVISQSSGWLNSVQTVTASIGIATIPDQSCTVKNIVNRADQALYEAKETGRNKVVFWDQGSRFMSAGGAMAPPAIAKVKPEQTGSQGSGMAMPDMEVVPMDAISFSPTQQQSIIDPVTKLPSRFIFTDRVAQSIARAVRNNKKVAVLQISLASFDKFAAVFSEAAATS